MELPSIYNIIVSVSRFKLFRSSLFIIVAGSLLLIINEYIFRIRFSVFEAIPYALYWLIIAATFSSLILIPWQRYYENNERLMIEAFIAGIILGLVVAIYRVFSYYQLWTLFNLLAEPMRTALFGLLATWVLKQKNQTLIMNQIT